MSRITILFLLAISYSYGSDSSDFALMKRRDFQISGVAYSVNVMRVIDRQVNVHAQYALVCPYALEETRRALLLMQPRLVQESRSGGTDHGRAKVIVMLNESVQIVPESNRIYLVSGGRELVVETMPMEACSGSDEEVVQAVIEAVRKRVEPGATDNPVSAP